MNSYIITSKTIHFDETLKSGNDLWLLDPDAGKLGFDRTTFFSIENGEGRNIQIRFDWCNYSTADQDISYLIVPESGKLFFGARFFWGVVDLLALKTDRQENCVQFWNFARQSDTIVVITESEALALSLNGTTIDKVPIDPPFDSKMFPDRIEFDSPVFGRQTLKLQK